MRITKKEQKALNNCIKSEMLNDIEINCINQWILRYCINSDYYYLNFLINGFLNEKNFILNKDEQIHVSEFYFGDYKDSKYHNLWIALYFFQKEINRL